MLEIDDDVESCTLCRFCDPLDQFLRIRMIQSPLEIHEQGRELIMPFRLDAQPAILGMRDFNLPILFVTCNAFGIRCAACNVGSFACNVLSAVATSDKDPGDMIVSPTCGTLDS